MVPRCRYPRDTTPSPHSWVPREAAGGSPSSQRPRHPPGRPTCRLPASAWPGLSAAIRPSEGQIGGWRIQAWKGTSQLNTSRSEACLPEGYNLPADCETRSELPCINFLTGIGPGRPLQSMAAETEAGQRLNRGRHDPTSSSRPPASPGATAHPTRVPTFFFCI